MPLPELTASIDTMLSAENLGAFFASRWGQYAMIITFFGLVITFLRVLYGPKGFFRDPEWDRWNEAALRKEEEDAAQSAAVVRGETAAVSPVAEGQVVPADAAPGSVAPVKVSQPGSEAERDG